MRAVVTAYGKVNLLLDVMRKRADGYHEVSMVMQAIRLADYVAVEEAAENVLVCRHQFLPKNQDNLAMRAALLLQERFPTLPQVKVTLEKYIPVAAGLAGGSSDCAAVLLGMNALFGLGLSRWEMMALGAEIGSDVPFCLGGATALATGRGEQITALPDCPKLHLVLVKPRFGVSTAEVYKNLCVGEIKEHLDTAEFLRCLCLGRKKELMGQFANVLEQSTFALEPYVGKLKENLRAQGAEHVLMSGSGPTMFAAFEQKKEAVEFYRRMKRMYGRVVLTETMTSKEMEGRVKLYE